MSSKLVSCNDLYIMVTLNLDIQPRYPVIPFNGNKAMLAKTINFMNEIRVMST